MICQTFMISAPTFKKGSVAEHGTKNETHMSSEQNKAIVRRYREAHNTNQLDQLDEIVDANLISHNLLPGLPPGLVGGKVAHM